jgi:signal peptidase I
MTANEPPNPYTAPAAALADGAPAATAGAGTRKPSRLLAVVMALVSYPLSGAGLYLLGRSRRAVFWVITTVLLWSIMIAAVRTSQPMLAVIAMAVTLLSTLGAVVDTAFAKPGPARALGSAWLVVLALFVGGRGGAFAVRHWLVEAFQIPSGAMIPTLLIGDHIFVKKGRGGVARGDVIVFEFPQDRQVDYVKRAVAIGGDTIEVKDGVPLINGAPLAHQALDAPCVSQDGDGAPERCTFVRETDGGRARTIILNPHHPAQDFPRTIVPPNEVFVLGDNRDNSYDSRRWGTVPVDHIKGVAKMIWWSKGPDAVRWSRVGHGVE